MSIENAIRKRSELYSSIGKSALHVQYPQEFELYVAAFELIDAKGQTLKYFIFPIMPSAISEQESGKSTITRTQGGISSLSTTTFSPVDITLSGNFGKKFKILLGTDYVDLVNAFKTVDGQLTINSAAKGFASFDDRIKTGYGTLQVLNELLQESNVVDTLGPRTLVFYNLAFGTSYVVKLMSKKIDMNQESNTLHNYYITLKGIAPLNALKTKDNLQKDAERLVVTDYLQKRTENLLQTLTSIL